MAQATQSLRYFIQCIGGSNFSLIGWAKACDSIRFVICAENGWIETALSFDETCTASSTTWRGKMNIYASCLKDQLFNEFETFRFQKVKL